MSGRRRKGKERERESEHENGWEEASNAMKPPNVNPLEAAACTDSQGYNPQTVICDDIMLQCQGSCHSDKACQAVNASDVFSRISA